MNEFERWYGEQRPRVLAACVALSGDLDASRDATDEAFTRALQRWASVAAMEAPGAWTQIVALNYLRRSLRRRRREPLAAHRPPTDDAGSSVPDAGLWAAVGRLPLRQQTALVLRYVHDLAYAQVAATMGISEGTVASTLNAARASLARLLSDSGITEEVRDG